MINNSQNTEPKKKRIRETSHVEISQNKMEKFKREIYPYEKLSNKDFILRLCLDVNSKKANLAFPPENFANNKRLQITISIYENEKAEIEHKGMNPREYIANAFRSALYGDNYISSDYSINAAEISKFFKKLTVQLRTLRLLFEQCPPEERALLIENTIKLEDKISKFADAPNLNKFFEPLQIRRRFTSRKRNLKVE
nr:hypothetical protein [uncultured Campylobacter sp.]